MPFPHVSQERKNYSLYDVRRLQLHKGKGDQESPGIDNIYNSNENIKYHVIILTRTEQIGGEEWKNTIKLFNIMT